MSFPTYSVFRPFAIFAGVFSIFQSLIWIGFAITGIVAYYCEIDFSGQTETMGSLLTLTFFNVYFRGTCVQADIPEIDMSLVNPLNLMPAGDVHAFVWVYLIMHLFWGISSLTLLTNARQKYVRYINIFVYIWIIITMIISVLDLALGILFAIDYDTLVHVLYEYPFGPGPLLAPVQVLATAVHVAGIMMVMAFRGWIFWIVNVSLAIFMFTQTFKIYDYNQMRRKTNGASNGGYVPEGDGMRRAPIDAYNMSQQQPRAQTFVQAPVAPSEYRRPLERISERQMEVESPVSTQPDWSQQQQQQRTFEPKPTVIVNRTLEPLASSQPIEPVIEERPDNRPIPPPPPPKNFMNTVVRRDVAAAKVARELNYRNSFNVTNNGLNSVNLRPTGLNLTNPGPPTNDADLPTPNYSPPMPRSNPFENRPPLRSVLRNSRFQ
ncbi:AGAP006547-PA-like protein [Anopheles sinensis]|uniref:AGAP006547-PA-like protein n=1 Tax=Anopheles sinensis TaxID=74873 RepID=A0A084WMP0_ANOSI|nr:AGAP006547-PA-like protein [Anopheles sinensis]